MTKKARSAQLFQKNIHLFHCPICKGPLKVIDYKSLVCENRHTFDIAKQGYVNLLTKPVKSNYDQDLFNARQNIILTSGLFQPLHEILTKIINDFQKDEIVLLDAGCGEGSHLNRISENINSNRLTGMGLDIAKEGVQQAARKDENFLWLVGDLANLPFSNQSVHIILNILSPANYKEFTRVLQKDGLVIKVIPRNNYLQQLRNALGKQKKKKTNNEQMIKLFQENFQEVSTQKLTYQKKLQPIEQKNLVKMTPLSWNVDDEQMNNIETPEITIDLDILIGKLI